MVVGRELGAPEPDARQGRFPEEERREFGRAGLLPLLTEPASGSGTTFPRTLRQVSVGDMVDGGCLGVDQS